MNKYNVYIRYTVETKVTIQADSEEQAMTIAEKQCSMDNVLHTPVGSEMKESVHKTIWKTEKTK